LAHMASERHHEERVKGLYNQLKQVFDSSEQSIYLHLDDVHKVCNDRFASLLGYGSPTEWSKVEKSFPDTFVDRKSQQNLVSAC